MISRILPFLIVVLIVILASTPAQAQAAEASAIDQTKVALDTVWVIVAGVLVMFMQAGFALVETGFTQAKNACNIIMKNLMYPTSISYLRKSNAVIVVMLDSLLFFHQQYPLSNSHSPCCLSAASRKT